MAEDLLLKDLCLGEPFLCRKLLGLTQCKLGHEKRDGELEQMWSLSKRCLFCVTLPTTLALHFFKIIVKIIFVGKYVVMSVHFGECTPSPEMGLSLGMFPAGNLMHPGCFPKVNCFSKCFSKLLTWYICKTSPVIYYYQCNNMFSITKTHQTELSKELCSNFSNYSNSPGVHCGFKLSDCTFFLCWYLNPLTPSKVQWSCSPSQNVMWFLC